MKTEFVDAIFSPTIRNGRDYPGDDLGVSWRAIIRWGCEEFAVPIPCARRIDAVAIGKAFVSDIPHRGIWERCGNDWEPIRRKLIEALAW